MTDDRQIERPRQARWVRTRQRILDATVEVLLQYGYAGLTMQRVQATAGVSRGALTNQFPSMAALAAAAIETIADRQGEELSAQFGNRGAAEATIADLVDALLDLVRRPTFVAGLELWGAARTDQQLRSTLLRPARRTGRLQRETTAAVLGIDPGSEAADLAADGLLCLLRGIALGEVLRPPGDSERMMLLTWLVPFADPSRRGDYGLTQAAGVETTWGGPSRNSSTASA